MRVPPGMRSRNRGSALAGESIVWRMPPRSPPGPTRSSATSAGTRFVVNGGGAAAETYSEWVQRAGCEATTAEPQYDSLKEALEHLSRTDRAVLSLRYEEEFGIAQIACIMGIPEGTVKSRLSYARQRLRRYLENRDE